MLLETDMILALIKPYDNHHNEALEFFEKYRGNIYLSPYTLIELDLLIKSKILRISDPILFFKILNDILEYYGVSIIRCRIEHFVEALRLRNTYNLTYFDSLHAGTAIAENVMIVSYDDTYRGIKGLSYRYPRDLLS